MSTRSQVQFTPLPAILAWVCPGLGHIARGERHRGVLVMAGVLFLFLGGVLIGGVDCVDRREDGLWFMAQALCGPVALVTDAVGYQVVGRRARAFQALSEEQRRRSRHEPWMLRKGLGRVNEMGTLYSALAGLMNLVAILDVLYVPLRRPGTPAPRAAPR